MFVNIILYIYYIVNFFVDILSELFQLLTLLHFLNILIRETKEIIKVEEAIVNKRIITLNKLELGKSATIISLLSRDDERRRMLDLGMLKGATIKAIQKNLADVLNLELNQVSIKAKSKLSISVNILA